MDQRSVTILILLVGPGGWKSKWSTRGSPETKSQTSLVGFLILSSAGLVSLLLSCEIFVLPVNGRYTNSILLPVLHIILLVAETTNLNLSYFVTPLQPRSSRITEVLVGVSEPMDCSHGFTTLSSAIKRVNSPTFSNLVLILSSSPRADIDRHLFILLWAFSLTVIGEQTERPVGKELGQLMGTKPITVSHQHAQIKGQYWPPCPFGGHVGARIKHFSSLRIVDHPSQVSWLMWVVAYCSWADENCYQQES